MPLSENSGENMGITGEWSSIDAYTATLPKFEEKMLSKSSLLTCLVKSSFSAPTPIPVETRWSEERARPGTYDGQYGGQPADGPGPAYADRPGRRQRSRAAHLLHVGRRLSPRAKADARRKTLPSHPGRP